MPRVVVIGAGASIDASHSKLPSATSFFSCIRNHPGLCSELGTPPFKETLEALLPLLLSNPNQLKVLDKVNIEDVFTLASLEAEMTGNDSRLGYLTELIRKTIVTCSQEVKKGGNYATFIEKTIDDQTSLISFNWDTLLDEALLDYWSPEEERDTQLHGLYAEYSRICMGDTQFDSAWGYRPPPVKSTLLAKPVYLKLHGSIDTVICKNQHCRYHAQPFRVSDSTSSHYCQDCYEKVVPFIVPPIQNKPIRQFHHIRRAWMLASKLIQQAEEVIVWGYSLPNTDYWSQWLMGHIWGNEAMCRKLVIIDPQVALTNRRTKITRPRMDFIKKFYPWKDYLQHEMKLEIYQGYDLYTNRKAVPLR